MLNKNYIFNGEPISEDFVIEAAEVEGLSVDEYVNQKDGLETVEVTDEIQTPVTEGKTNGAAAEGATATPVTGQAPESMESDLETGSLDLPDTLDNSQESIIKRRRLNALNDLEEASIMQQPIELDEVVVTEKAFDKTPLTDEQKRRLPHSLYQKLAKKKQLTVGHRDAAYKKGLYPGRSFNKAGADLLNQITTSNAKITDKEIDAQAFGLYFDLDAINKPISIVTTTKGGISTRVPTEAEKEKRVYDIAIASGANEKGAKDYLDTYLNFQKTKKLTPVNDEQKSTIEEYKSQGLSQVQNRNKELIAGEYPDYIREYVRDVLEPTPEDVQQRADERGSILNSRNALEDLSLQYTVESQEVNDGIDKVNKQIEDYDAQITDLTNAISTVKAANIFQMPGAETDNTFKLQSLVEERNGLLQSENVLDLKARSAQLGNKYSQLLDMEKSINSRTASFIKNYEEPDQVLSALSKDYSFSTRAALQLEKSFGGSIAIGTAYLARGVDYLVKNVAPYTTSATTAQADYNENIDNNVSKSVQSIFTSAVDYNQAIEERIAELPEAVKISEIKEGKASVFSFLRDSIANSTPSLLTIALPGAGVKLLSKGFTSGASIAAKAEAIGFNTKLTKGAANLSAKLFGIQTGGETLSSVSIGQKINPNKIKGLKKQLEETKDPIRKAQLEDQISELQNIIDTSTFKAGFAGVTTGLITGYTEKLITLGLFKDLNTIAKGVGNYKNRWIFETLYAGEAFGKAQIKEQGQEILEQISRDGLVRNVILGENVNAFENINADLVANTAVATTLMIGPGTINNVNNIIKENVTTKEELARYNNLSRELILAQSLPRAKRIAKTKELFLELGLADIVNISKMNKLSAADIILVGDITAAMRQVSRDAVTLGSSIKGLPTKSDIAKLEKLQQQYENLSQNKNKILDAAVNQENKKRLENADVVNNPQALFHMNLLESSAILASGLVGKGNNAIFIEADESGNKDLSAIEQFKGKEVTYKDKEGNDVTADLFDLISKGKRNAYQVDNNIIIDLEAARNQVIQSPIESDGKFAAVSPLHEVSHLRNKGKKINFNDESNKAAITESIAMLDDKFSAGEISEENYNAIKKRLAVYEGTGQYEEFMQVLSDAMNLGMINKSDFQNDDLSTAFKSLFRNIANNTFGNKSETFMQFNTGNDVYNYIDSFRKQIVSGVAVQQVDEEEDTVAFSSQASKITPKAQEFISLVDEGILTNEDLVQIINSPSSTSKDKFAAIDAVVEKNWPVISSSIQFDPTGNIPMDAVKEAVTEQMQGIFPEVILPSGDKVDRLNKPLFKDFDATRNNKVTTILGPNFLGRRQAEILERAKAINARTQGVDLSEARGIAAEETKTQKPTTTRESKLIDVRQSPRVKRVLPTLEKEIKLTEGDSSVEILNNNRSKFASEIYNIPEGKIEKVDNLTYSKNKPETSELGRIQQDFSNAQETERSIKTMPEFNVTTMESIITEQGEKVSVSPEVRGRSMKIGQTVLDFFYEPYTDPASKSTDRAVRAMAITNKSGRSKGKTTQTKVYRLKPEFKPNSQGKISPQAVSKAREWAGINVDLNELSKNERRNYATKLAAWARMRGGQVALSVADKSLPESAPKQQRADTRAGRSRLMFSEVNSKSIKEAAENTIAKNKNGEDVYRPPNIKLPRQRILDVYGKGVINKKETGKEYPTRDKTQKLPKDIAAVEGETVLQGSLRIINEFLTDNPELYDSTMSSVTAGTERGLMSTKEVFKSFFEKVNKKTVDGVEVKIEQVGKRIPYLAKAGFARKDFIESTKEEGFVENQIQQVDNLIDYFKAIESHLKKKPQDAWLFDAIVKDAQDNQNSILRFGAPTLFMNINEKGKIPLDVQMAEEHSTPQNNISTILLQAAINGNIEKVKPIVKAVYMQGGLTRVDDGLVNILFKSTMPDFFYEEIVPAILSGKVKLEDGIGAVIRMTESGVNMDNYKYFPANKTFSEYLFGSNGLPLKEQARLTRDYLSGKITLAESREEGSDLAKNYIKLEPSKIKASKNNNKKGPTSINFSEQAPNQEVLDNLGNADAAMANARNPKAPVKKIRVFDFDDTLARSNSQVLYEMPDGTTGKLNATQFAQRAGELESQGAEFDFSEFSKVVDGKRGPVFKAIENIVKARGAEDVFILTARPADAAGPIKEFMDALGVNLPIENIVGLGDGKAEAKARWMTAKAAEGYNDFFFVDDAYKNVKAVQDALEVFDVKSKTQQAKVKFSDAASLDKDFNDILEQSTGIASEKEYKRVKAEVAGASRGMAIRGIPYSAQDFVGLLYETLGKGKVGDAQMAWYKTHLFDPYSRAMTDIDNARLTVMADYRALKKQLGLVPKNLRKKIPGEPFTREQAVRVYIWNQQGSSVPGISQSDLKELTDFVENNAELKVFADQLIAIQKGDEYAKPKEGWPAGSITTDLLEGINTIKRAKYLEQWKENKDIIFSEKNMNKLEAAYGKKYRKALENMLGRMESGRNRNFSDDTLTARFTDWLQGSVGTIMFFNTRSSLLQTLSSINFINFTDNNPLAAAKAFANQKQYWSDFMTLINSDFLKARRSGLRMNVNEADIADMAKKGGPKAVIGKLLQLGFTPTQIADSFAIASGGATFYRNRIKTYQKQGMSKAEAEEKAFTDFRENAEESQQSSRPDRISMQQAGGLGRLILAFQNTPAQYARLIDKAVRDLKNGRGDAKTNISKIVYYSTVQNLLFNALQQAVFAFAFDDEEPEDKEKKEKYLDVANGMMDSLLRGTGLAGGVVSVTKNAIIRIVEESEKDRPKFEKVGADLLKIAPPVSSKLSKINQAARSYQWDKKEMQEKGWSLDNPAYLAAANVIAATTNVPLDRVVKKGNNVANATDSDLETWERLALLGGWQDWEIGIDEEKPANKPQPRKSKFKSKSKLKKKRL